MNTADPALARTGTRGHTAAQRVWRAPAHHPAVLLLWPLSALFGLTVRARRMAYQRGWLHSERAPLPVISVGNLTVGGSGKTPFTRWLSERLLTHGQRPAILHGGSAHDEPALHKFWQPGLQVLAARDRASAARTAAAAGATVALLDDGLQHLRLARDLDIVLVSADTWTEPQRLLPSGAWREPLGALRNADAVVITRKAASQADAQTVRAALLHTISSERRERTAPPVCIAALELNDFVTLQGQPAPAPARATVMCAIADPLSFAKQLAIRGVQVERTLTYADHYEYTRDDLQRARQQAGSLDLIVTEKDAVKIAPLDPAFQAVVARQRVVIELGEKELWLAVERVLS